MKERQISNKMMEAFQTGKLLPLLEAVKKDDMLDMELRGDAVNIYYRGGSIFKITNHNEKYSIYFNENYCAVCGNKLESRPDVEEAVRNIPLYKQAMDLYIHAHPQYEREFQQIIARENNCNGKISASTDYYIADIEYVDDNSRFDMVALKKLPTKIKDEKNIKVSLSLIEVKYGDGALKGSSGIKKHLDDFTRFLGNPQLVSDFCEDMSKVFKQKCELGLVDGIQEKQGNVTIDSEKPEVIFIFANHNPKSSILDNVINEIKQTKTTFPIYIAKSLNMGYCLYEDNLELIENNG